ncbi:hypothetical protein Arcve_2062 [Archaeoglobus veneficus SNP6]|uniref:Uncharacterized protein n=1 Tax=Archaeoglobus veneficus (strain DSM 11195 / SNP6) TaxID=693661 RepID=F2KSI2_ARCVS|nr:hypothetical protein Arcve_2062 [Archaeoglobus veneficus SNP6]
MKVPARLTIKLADIMELFNHRIPYQKKAKLLETYGFDSKFRINAENLAKDKRLRMAIYRRLREVLSQGEIR